MDDVVRDIQIRARVAELREATLARVVTVLDLMPPDLRAELIEARIQVRLAELRCLMIGSAWLARRLS